MFVILGNSAEGVPVEVMPEEYGGEAPSIKELDRQSNEMMEKYARWLKETELFRTDEEKRVKKPSSWWGIFGSSNNNPAPQIEKERQILKNLQIDWFIMGYFVIIFLYVNKWNQ